MLIDSILKCGMLPLSYVLANVNSLKNGFDVGVPCLFKSCFGIECWGCGITRAISSIWRGDIVESMSYHPLGIIVFALLAYIFFAEVYRIFICPKRRYSYV